MPEKKKREKKKKKRMVKIADCLKGDRLQCLPLVPILLSLAAVIR